MAIISAAALHADPRRHIFDCRFNLAEPAAGASAYAEGHIPGAQYLHLDHDLSGSRTGKNGRHPLPDPHVFASRLGSLGLTPDMPVAIYDDAGGMFAARVWWMLHWIGHQAVVSVLDGGIQAWLAAGFELSQEVQHPAAKSYLLTKTGPVVKAQDVLNFLGASSAYLLDARSADRFRGENETLDPVGGHIPGAKNRFFRDNLTDDGHFKPAHQLRTEFMEQLAGADPSTVVHSCGSGVTACHNLLAMEVAGLTGSKLYAGSWSEWSSDPSRPMEKG
ncbi:MAG TPA: sulfurtransferase [Rhodocyclaceae bacterium]|nr:sulfurtransferase [Rhodocyclaceae bacterium]